MPLGKGPSLTCAHQNGSLAPTFMCTYLHVHKQHFRVYLFRGHGGDLRLGGTWGQGINIYLRQMTERGCAGTSETNPRAHARPYPCMRLCGQTATCALENSYVGRNYMLTYADNEIMAHEAGVSKKSMAERWTSYFRKSIC